MHKQIEPQDSIHSNVGKIISPYGEMNIFPDNAANEFCGFGPCLTTSGAIHSYTEHVWYNSDDYLRVKHQHGILSGTFTSEIYDLGSAARRLVYVLASIVVIGADTTWDGQVPIPTTWSQVGVSTRTWSEIFDLTAAPIVNMRLYYGNSSPPTNYIDKMEILSTIVPSTARYFRIQITITDPNPEVYAYIENYTLKFCT